MHNSIDLLIPCVVNLDFGFNIFEYFLGGVYEQENAMDISDMTDDWKRIARKGMFNFKLTCMNVFDQ